MLKVINNLIESHIWSYEAIKRILPHAKIGVAKNNVYYEPYHKNNFFDKLIVNISNKFGNHYFLKHVKDHLDFIGLNYYFYQSLTFNLIKGYRVMNTQGPRSDLGWRTYPEGIYHLLMDLKMYEKPIFITENGIANARDDMRKRYILEHLMWAKKAMDHGVDVKGYCYWSLTDTYEWENGFDPKFGLVEIDFKTFERKIRPSASIFKEIDAAQINELHTNNANNYHTILS